MNARGSTEVVVASIGLSMGALSQNLFTMIVAMAVVTTMAMPPMLRWALSRLPMREDERLRLEKEAFEAKGFVTQLERLLVAVDESPKGQFAGRIAGLIAGSRGMPVTVLRLNAGADGAVGPMSTVAPPLLGAVPEPAPAEAAIMAAVETSKTTETEVAEAPGTDVDVLTKVQTAPAEEAIAEEARKGYDFMVIGREKTVAAEGGFHADIVAVAKAFEGPLAIAAARGVHQVEPLESTLDILVPITGTEVSRRGAEVALAIARASRSAVTALYVPHGAAAPRRRRFAGGRRGEAEAILKDTVALAEQYGVPIRTAVRVNLTAEDAILRQARLGGHNLVVMGVTRRPGETLVFGTVATAVLEASDRSILFVAS
jgi:nucleotide-binding universal stress UspA family protein